MECGGKRSARPRSTISFQTFNWTKAGPPWISESPHVGCYIPSICVRIAGAEWLAKDADFTCAQEDINVISEQTEIRELDMPNLSPIQQKFILHWGEMGTRWGINRTVAQIHA